jgi:hypothetical protein
MKPPLFYIFIPDRRLAQVYGFAQPEHALDFFRRTEMSESSVRVFNRDQWIHNANDMPYDRYLWADQYQTGLDLFDKGAAYVLAIWTSGNPPDLTPLQERPDTESLLHHWAELAGRDARFSWILDYDQARLCLDQPRHLPAYQRERVLPLLRAKMEELAPRTGHSSAD